MTLKTFTISKSILIFLLCAQSCLNASALVTISLQPFASQIVCPGTGKPAEFTVIATTSLVTGITYQWKKNGVVIAGAITPIYNILAVVATDAGAYQVDVTDISGTVSSSISYLNVAISAQPVTAQTLAAANTCILSVTASNTTGYQWQKDGTDISGATAATYTINSITPTNNGTYTVKVINTAGNGCASIFSTASALTISNTLYLKSTGNVNALANWGVNVDGTGSNPFNFTYPDYIFKTENQLAASVTNDLTITGTLDLVNAIVTIAPGTTLSAGKLIQTGMGKLAGSNTSNLIVNGLTTLSFAPGSQQLNSLLIAGGTSTLNTSLSIAATGGSVVVAAAGILNTSDNLTLKSDANGTAIIGNSAGTINGKVTVERYIPARRAWRLMAAPIAASNIITDIPTINSAWQEGAVSSIDNPNPGYGTAITGGTIANGFDQSPNNGIGLKGINGGTLTGIANTALPINQYPAYFFFIRGNRAYDILHTTAYTPALTTTLRITGKINQGTQTPVPIAATGYTVAANPFASPIDLAAVLASSTNIKNRFYVWNPQLGGTNGVGAYVLLDWNGASYTTTPTAAVANIIESGQAFFLQSNDNLTPGSLVINEQHKIIGNSNIPFGRVATNGFERELGIGDLSVTADLKILNADNSLSIADGILVHYNNVYSNDVNNDDALKFTNTNENISITNPTQALTLERRQFPVTGDTLKLKLSNYKNNNYQLSISSGLLGAGIVTKLNDNYLNKTVDVINALEYPFTITADAASGAANRFNISYNKLVVLPVKFLSLNITNYKNDAVVVKWTVTEAANISSYEVQKSADGINYTAIAIRPAVITAGINEYTITDAAALSGTVYYRIKAINLSNEIVFSKVAVVELINNKTAIGISPNPVTGGNINLHIQQLKEGQYNYSIVNAAGQIIAGGSIKHTAGQTMQSIKISKNIAAGNYTFSLKNESSFYQTKLFIIKE